MQKFLAVAILTSMIATASPAMATVGPVRVVLNIYNNKMGNARANTIPWYVVYFRYNVDIKEHQWVKVWFPAKEASSKQSDICDQLPALNGILNHKGLYQTRNILKNIQIHKKRKLASFTKSLIIWGTLIFLIHLDV